MKKASNMSTNNSVLVPRIESRIQVISGLRVMVDADLATLYGVPTKRPIGFLTHEDKKTPKASRLTKGRKAP